MDCIFCKLASHQIPTEIVYEDDLVFAFKDAAPVAPIHYLFILKEHVPSLQEATRKQLEDLTHLFQAIQEVAKRDGFAESGYRLVTNVGPDGGQSVHHMHFHVLAGKAIRFPGFDGEE